jgi:U2-associated protein SR140
VARLHLICDILHNSAASVPSAWKFRLEFQSRLGIVFDHLAGIYHSFPGRITAETFKKQITSIVDIWEDWIVFPPDFTSELRMRLEGVTKEVGSKPEDVPEIDQKSVEEYSSRFKASSFQLTTGPADGEVQLPEGEDWEPMDVASDVDGEPVGNLDGELLDDVDGEPVDDLDGEPVDIDGDPVNDDVDGVPVADEDMDGLPMDDVDGEAMNEDEA